ncbi:MAG: SNF2 helicase-associated domain-containing protein, partial [Desulfobacterales bacterium]|nr:SNF2 helicase-associated domain-containing protein [Desulfobacterales bacterium]
MPQLLLGDLMISEEEARRLLAQSEGLALLKNRWVAVDPARLKEALSAYEKFQRQLEHGGLTLRDALRMELFPEKTAGEPDLRVDCGISRGKWLESVVQKLKNPELIGDVRPDRRFLATLRPYQQKGINWLHILHSLGFGACLADDMGLGKTIQLLGFLNVIRSGPLKASLLVIPASLMKLKQLCNHADQYLGTGGFDEKDSGKFERLREVCEVIHEKREKALIFSQFKEMTAPLCAFLEGVFGRKGLVLHGSTPVRQRKDIIARFQGDERIPFM